MNSLTLTLLGAVSAVALPEISISKFHPPKQDNVQRGSVGSSLFWAEGRYIANISIGTPPQMQTVSLDTGSSDLWLAIEPDVCSTYSSDLRCNEQAFNPNASNTYQVVDAEPGAFRIGYMDSTGAKGTYASDTVGIGSVSLTSVQFAVVNNTDAIRPPLNGIWGIGYSRNEAKSDDDEKNFYPNLVDVMVQAGAIKSRLYSIYLSSEAVISIAAVGWGSILFGGIDTSKYSGTLTTLNLLPWSDPWSNHEVVYTFATSITAAELNISNAVIPLWDGGGNDADSSDDDDDNQPLPALTVILDTGATLSRLPTVYYRMIVAQLRCGGDTVGYGPYGDPRERCLCPTDDAAPSLVLTFGGKARIEVSSRNLFDPVVNGDGNVVAGICALNILQVERSKGSIGDSILRSMYTVFDLDNGQVSIAQAATEEKMPNVVEVPAGPNGLASVMSDIVQASDNTATIASAYTGTISPTFRTVTSPLGTATGIDAVPSSYRTTLHPITNVILSGTRSSTASTMNTMRSRGNPSSSSGLRATSASATKA